MSKKQVPLKAGMIIICPRCGGEHALRSSKDADGEADGFLLYYLCRGKAVLASVDGRGRGEKVARKGGL